MSNLLPLQTKKDVFRLYIARLVFLAALLLGGAGIIAAALLAPSYLIVQRYRGDIRSDVALASASSTSAADKDFLRNVQLRLRQLEPYARSTSTPSEAVLAALALRPAGVTIDRISYTPGKTGATILLAGSAQKGDQVNAYRRAITEHAAFESVSVPVGALAGISAGRFSITITTK